MQRDLTQGPIRRGLILFSLPLIAGNLLQQLYNIVDTWVVGRFLGNVALAAVGSAFSLMVLLTSLLLGLCMGSGVVFSQLHGEGRPDRMKTAVVNAFVMIALIALLLTVLVAACYILLAQPLILLFNRNPVIVDYGRMLLISQVALYPAFGLCYMMTITYQTIGESRYGLFLSMIRQGLFYVPLILILPVLLGVRGIYAAQPAADVLTLLVCVLCIRPMKRAASRNMAAMQDDMRGVH